MKKLFTFLLALVASVSAIYASDTEVDGIWYDFDKSNNTATVTYRGSSYDSYYDEYSGSVVIPPSITYSGTTYSVTSIGNSAFSWCSSLTSVTIPNSVTSIGDLAFSGCSSLTSITIPNSVTSIGGGAFSICTSLTSVTIPNSVTSIGNGAFAGCSSLTSIIIPNSVTSIGDDTFSGCSSLTSIIIPNSVTSIGDDAFYGCSSLNLINVDIDNPNYCSIDGVLFNKDKTTLVAYPEGKQGAYTIPNSVTSIGYQAFQNCSSLTSVTIPNSVTSIGDEAFEFCKLLTSITIPNSVTSIGSEAFRGCSSLTSVTIPNSVISIGERAFYYCSSLNSITIPNSVTSIGSDAFSNCSSLTSVTINSNAIVNIAYTDSDNLSNIFGSQVTKYIIGDNVKGIGDYAFSYCRSLTSVTIPNSMTSIGKWAFDKCDSLTSVILTASSEEEFCKGQGNSLLWSAGANYQREIQINGTKVTKFTIPNSVTSIVNSTFRGCSSLTSVTIPNSVTSIGDQTFSGCSSLTSITIPNSVTSIGNHAFSYCSSLTSITIPNSVTSIGGWAFSGCGDLTSVIIGNSVTSIGYRTFYNCSSLTSVTIGESVTSIVESAFDGCWSLPVVNNIRYADTYLVEVVDKSFDTYTIKEGTKWIGHYAFSGCSSLISITIPNSVTSIGNYAFYNCKNIESVTIPNSVTTIGEYAFFNCDLTSVIIGNSVTSIGDYAFNCEDNYNSSLTSVVCWAEKPAIISYLAFDSRVRYIGLYVPCGCGDAYREATGWNIFNTFFEMEGYSIFTFVNDAKMGTAEVNNRTCKNAQIVATPKPGFRFVQWSDGVVNNLRNIVLTQDTVLIAEFAEKPSYVVEVIYNTDHGTVNGQGTYKEDEEVTLTATANDGYKFHKWSDGVVNNPRSIVLTQDTVLIAEFAEIPSYVVEVIYNTDHGTVNGQGTYKEDEEVTLTATANDGYKFHKWSNGVTDNPYTFFVKSDVALEAKFTSTEGIEEVLDSEVHTTKVLRDGQVLILRAGKTYTMQGQEVK